MMEGSGGSRKVDWNSSSEREERTRDTRYEGSNAWKTKD